jgi:hypothetical protein
MNHSRLLSEHYVTRLEGDSRTTARTHSPLLRINGGVLASYILQLVSGNDHYAEPANHPSSELCIDTAAVSLHGSDEKLSLPCECYRGLLTPRSSSTWTGYAECTKTTQLSWLQRAKLQAIVRNAGPRSCNCDQAHAATPSYLSNANPLLVGLDLSRLPGASAADYSEGSSVSTRKTETLLVIELLVIKRFRTGPSSCYPFASAKWGAGDPMGARHVKNKSFRQRQRRRRLRHSHSHSQPHPPTHCQ